MFRILILAAMVMTSVSAIPPSIAQAAELDGVTMPETRIENGVTLRLNGLGLRTYSWVGIPIYVAGLYLEHHSDDADTILKSPEPKVLDIRFLRDVPADKARESWHNGLMDACQPPCQLNPRDLDRFLAAVPAVHKGDESILLFTPKSVNVTFNGKPMGVVADPHFATVMLASFIGPKPPTEKLKEELLGDRP